MFLFLPYHLYIISIIIYIISVDITSEYVSLQAYRSEKKSHWWKKVSRRYKSVAKLTSMICRTVGCPTAGPEIGGFHSEQIIVEYGQNFVRQKSNGKTAFDFCYFGNEA